MLINELIPETFSLALVKIVPVDELPYMGK